MILRRFSFSKYIVSLDPVAKQQSGFGLAVEIKIFCFLFHSVLERQFVSAPGHRYYNCNTTKTSVANPIGA